MSALEWYFLPSKSGSASKLIPFLNERYSKKANHPNKSNRQSRFHFEIHKIRTIYHFSISFRHAKNQY